MAQLLVLSSALGGAPALPALELLSHRVRQIPAEPAQLVNAPNADVIFVDARTDLVGAKSLCKILNTTGLDAPLVLVTGSEGKGLSRLVTETCDQIVSIPISAATESLNAGIAASVALYQVATIRAASE